MAKTDKRIAALINEKGGIRLDIGCGLTLQPGWVGLDIQDFDNIDYIKHDFNVFPWPLPDECAIQALASHVIEHIPPHDFGFIKFMNEVWRVLKPDCQFAAVLPYAGSPGYWQDPTHCNPVNETTWLYFDPLEQRTNGVLYKFYKPKPWRINTINWDPVGNMEVLLEKRREDWSYYD